MGETVADLGENALVARIISRIGRPRPQRVPLGPGDDAAVLACPDGRVVLTTDVLIEGRHFRRDWSSAGDVGHRCVAESLADVAAMGARGRGVVIGLGIPPDLEVEWVDEFLAAATEECARAGADLVGGDVVSSDTVVVSVTATGDLEGRAPVTRAGAVPGDVLAVAGRLGWAAAGLAVLSRGFRSPRALVEAHRRPEPPYASGVLAAKSGATAMMDVSDGLILDATRMAHASGVALDIDSSSLPLGEPVVTAAAAYHVDPLTWVLGGGDDHALLATFPAGGRLPKGFAAIGRAREPGESAVLVDGEVPGTDPGYEHFRVRRG